MALQILGQGPPPEEIAAKLKASIEAALPGAAVEVRPGSGGHFELRVESRSFEGQSRVAQQQSVYRAIAHLMKGTQAPVHAIDRMECVVPDAD